VGGRPQLIQPPRSDVLLSIRDLEVALANDPKRAVVRGVSLEVHQGEVLGIVGESGSGKSMTALSIVKLLPSALRVSAGSIWFNGEELTAASAKRLAEIRGRHIGFVFQDPMAALNPVMRIGEQVSEPLPLHHVAYRAEAMRRAVARLQEVGIAAPLESVHRFPHEFSGGMRQRAMIAMALIATPELIIADEPTTALDVTVQAQLLDLFRQLNRDSGVALILISHDLGVVGEFCHRIAVMYAGRIVEVGETKDLISDPQHPYTRALLASMPSTRLARDLPLRAIAGDPATADALPSGCPFHPRCSYRVEKCRTAEPPLLRVRTTFSACWVAQRTEGFGPSPQTLPARLPQAESSTIRSTADSMLRVENLRRYFSVAARLPWQRRRELHAVDGVSFTLGRGETLGIVGESGCGKSTVARCILRLIEPDEGRILFRGQDITSLSGNALRAIRRHIQPVFQDPYASLNPRWSVRRIITEPLVAQGVGAASARRRVDETLDLVGLGGGYSMRLPHELSGGQRQRVAIARALACRPDLLVADEPLSSLDLSIQAQVINLLREMQAALGLSILFVSHDLRVVRYLSTTIAVMYLGKIVEFGDTEAVCSRPGHPYTAALLSAVLPAPGDQPPPDRIELAGELPSPLDPPSGCRFRTRCSIARPNCALQEPPLMNRFLTQVACHYPLNQAPIVPLRTARTP
jgi:peptide/nickel transport system ATP-binding protein